MPVDVMRTIASVGASMLGSGTVSTRTSRLPCQATAFMGGLLEVRVQVARAYPTRHRRGCGRVSARDAAQRWARVRISATTAPLASE